MKLFNDIFNNQPIRLIDHSNKTTIFSEKNEAKISFALEDAIATTVGQSLAPTTVRLWVHDRTLVLGIPDSRLEHLEQGVSFIRSLDYDVIVRNSGGLAVLLDRNVLNISFILPNKDQLPIHDGYELMYYFTKRLFENETDNIFAYEIKGSYCPGDYDLSINGKKFAGISQRRVRNGVAVQMYLDIAGSSFERAKIVKQFYEFAKGEKDTSFVYPDVNPNVMASINELLGTHFTVKQIVNRIRFLLLQYTNKLTDGPLIEEEKQIFFERLKQMYKRNEKIDQMKRI